MQPEHDAAAREPLPPEEHVLQRSKPRVLRDGMRVLGVAVREEPWMFTLSVTASAIYAAMTVGTAQVLGWATDAIVLPAFRTGRTTSATLLGGALAITGVALLKALGVAGRRFFAGLMQYRLQATYRRAVTRQYLRLPLAWHQRHPTGQLLSNANADVEAVWAPIAPLPMAVGVLFMLVIAAVSMLVTDVPVALVALLVFPAIALLNVVYQRRLSPIATRAQQLRAEVSEVAHESFEGGLVVKTLGREQAETDRFGARARQLRDANVAVGRVRGLFDPLLEAMPNLGVLAVLLIGSVRLEHGAIQAGDLVQIAFLFTLLAWPIRALGWVLAELPRGVVGWKRVRGVLDATGSLSYGTGELAGRIGPDNVLDGLDGLDALDGRDGRDDTAAARLEVRDVRFGYGEPILHDVSFQVAAGSTVAIVGPTGSGKSTLTGLLVRLFDPASGQVLLDGVDVRDVRQGGVAATAALVPQQAFLFDDTIRGNVTLGAGLPDTAVWEALRVAQADGFVAALPDGLDTRVGERGATLSGGQRQRLALARALVRRPRLLVLDDATSSVDPQVEERILRGLRESQADGGATVVVVAYRKATISLADEVVYLEHGRVVDRGGHAALLDRSTGYRNLVNAYERAEAEREAVEVTETEGAETEGTETERTETERTAEGTEGAAA